MDTNLPTIEYASIKPIRLVGLPHRPAYRLMWISISVGLVGVCIAIVYRMTGSSQVRDAGMFWLAVGGLATLYICMFTCADTICACFNPADRKKGVLGALLVFVVAILNFPVAILAIWICR